MENKKRRKKLLISGLLLLISGIILFAIAAVWHCLLPQALKVFPLCCTAFAFALFRSWRIILFILSLIFTLRRLCSSDKSRHIWIKRQPKRLTFYFFLRGTHPANIRFILLFQPFSAEKNVL